MTWTVGHRQWGAEGGVGASEGQIWGGCRQGVGQMVSLCRLLDIIKVIPLQARCDPEKSGSLNLLEL